MKTLRWIAANCALLVALVVTALPAQSAAPVATPAPGVNETCLMCHADKDAKGAAGKSIAVDPTSSASVHGEISLNCTDCHATRPRKAAARRQAEARQLRECHEKAVKEYAGTVHGRRARAATLSPRTAPTATARTTSCARRTRLAHQPRQRRGHVLQVPWQRRHRRQGQAARRQRRHQVPRQHPRQGAEGRGAGFGADVHELPRRTRHPREVRGKEPHQPREHPGHLRHLPQAGERRLPRRQARQAAAGRQHGRARLHRLPLGARHPAARNGQVPDRRHQGMRHLPRRVPGDLPRHVPRPGDGARLCAHGDLRVVPRRARRAARRRTRRRRCRRRTG